MNVKKERTNTPNTETPSATTKIRATTTKTQIPTKIVTATTTHRNRRSQTLQKLSNHL